MDMVLNSFEISFLQEVREGWTPKNIIAEDDTSLIRFGIWTLLKIGAMIRKQSVYVSDIEVMYKDDGSPVTLLEKKIEEFIINSIHQYIPEASFEGEESGGTLEMKGVSLALDPLDGTRSFLSHAGTSATSLIIYRDGQPFIGMVMNPANGEIGYVLKGNKSRLIQLDLFGVEDIAVDLPTGKKENTEKILVNFHPSKKSEELVKSLYKCWKDGEIHLVKSISGSPALALLEAAKGYCSYINLWKGQPALSYDLAAGILLVRGAGGDVINDHGDPIPFIGQHGSFIAGLSPVHLELLRKNIKNI
jgi:fructose-1,6-bisphosphatase/inositol monophosphatase family enzyme